MQVHKLSHFGFRHEVFGFTLEASSTFDVTLTRGLKHLGDFFGRAQILANLVLVRLELQKSYRIEIVIL